MASHKDILYVRGVNETYKRAIARAAARREMTQAEFLKRLLNLFEDMVKDERYESLLRTHDIGPLSE